MQVREDIVDIKDKIDDCKEDIYELKYKLRWFRRTAYVFYLGIMAFILSTLDIPRLQSALQNIGEICVGIPVVAGIIIGVFSFPLGISDLVEAKRELNEAKQNLAKLLRKLGYLNEQATENLSPTEQRKHDLPVLIASYRKRADRYRGCFTVTQVIIILLSATITSLSGGWLDKYKPLPWAVPVFSGIISVITSFTLFFKPREKGANLQQTADAMDLEYTACNFGIVEYKGKSKKEALEMLAEKTELLRKDQQQRQQQLEQSSQEEGKILQSGGK